MKAFLFAWLENNFFSVASYDKDSFPKEICEALQRLEETGTCNFPDYSPKDSLDEEGWFVLRNFSKKNIEHFPKGTEGANQLDYSKYEDIKDLVTLIPFYGNLGHIYLLNHVTPALFIKGKTIINFQTSIPEVTVKPRMIVVKDLPDGIYIPNYELLIFKKIDSMKPIFPSLSGHYTKASKEQVEKILNESLVNLQLSYDKIGVSNLKRINSGLSRKIEDLSINEIRRYNRNYKLGLTIQDQKVQLSNNEDIKNFLFILDERPYTAKVSKEKRIATSIRPVKAKEK